MGNEQTNTKSAIVNKPENFVSLFATCPLIKLKSANSSNAGADSTLSYYDAMGYADLVPNENFAALLNVNGEIQVGDTVYRIAPEGTFYYSEYNADYARANFDSLRVLSGIETAPNTYQLADGIFLYKTFADDMTIEIGDSTTVDDKNISYQTKSTSIDVPTSNFEEFDAD
ncbi:hypothetical protein [Mangrovibacterium marinum]|uniref:hypothetical protein n=1 Tax=Mangrovibacterium marinum TaxID=1639118 RepID=UPI000D3169BD|nr:hypothetical protein [Mangrovibacterium marinum]